MLNALGQVFAPDEHLELHVAVASALIKLDEKSTATPESTASRVEITKGCHDTIRTVSGILSENEHPTFYCALSKRYLKQTFDDQHR